MVSFEAFELFSDILVNRRYKCYKPVYIAYINLVVTFDGPTLILQFMLLGVILIILIILF